MAENDLNVRGYVPTGSNTQTNQEDNNVAISRADQVEIDKRKKRDQQRELEKGFLQTTVPATIQGQVNPNVDYNQIFKDADGNSLYDNPNFRADIENATSFTANTTLADYYAPFYNMSSEEFKNEVAKKLNTNNPATREGRPIQLEDLQKPLTYTMLPQGYEDRLNFMIKNNIITGTASDGANLEFPLKRQLSQFSDINKDTGVFESSSVVSDSNSFFSTDPKEGAKRLFGLLKKNGMSDTKAAQFAEAQSNGTLEEFRKKNNLTDMFGFFGNVGMAISEGIQNFLIENKDMFPTVYTDTVGGMGAGPFSGVLTVPKQAADNKVVDKKVMYDRIKFASDKLADKMGVSVDDANLVLGYSPDFFTRIAREVQPSIYFGSAVTIGGTIRALRESARFKTFVKDKYKGKTYEDSLKIAGEKFRVNEADIIEEYFKDRLRVPVFMNWRKNGVLERLNTASELKGSAQILSGGKGLALGRIQDLETRKKVVSEQIKELKRTRTIDGKKADVSDQVEKLTNQYDSLESQINKTKIFNAVPKYWRSSVVDEVGVATGIAVASQLWQNNSEDVSDMTLPLVELVGGVSGATGLRLTTNSAARLLDDTLDFMKFVFAGPDSVGAKDFWKYISEDKRIANKAFEWISNAPPEVKEQMFSGIQAQKSLTNELASLTVTQPDGTVTNLIQDPTILNKAFFKLTGLSIIDAVGESLEQSVSSGDVSKFSNAFLQMNKQLKEKVTAYTDISLALEKLQAAKFHPDASKALSTQIKTLESAMGYLKQGLDNQRKFVNEYADNYEEFLMFKLQGIPVASQMKPGKVTQDYKNEIKMLDKFRINQMADDGVELDVIQATMSKKLEERHAALKKSSKFVESYLASNDNNANILSGQFETLKGGYWSKADTAFTVLRRDFGEQSGRDIYMDGTNIINAIRGNEENLFDMDDLKEFLPVNHHKKLAGFKVDMQHSKAALLLFEDAAGRFFKKTKDQNIKNLYESMRNAENGDKLTDFEIWETISDYVDPSTGNKFDISLPVTMDEWHSMVQAFSRSAYEARGTRRGLSNKSVYQIASEDAEDVAFGFKANYFDDPKDVGDVVIKRWKDAKGLWHDYAFRYKTNKFAATIGKVRGVDISGGVEYETHPSKWFDEILQPLTENPNIDANTLDSTVMSRLAATFGGQAVFDKTGNISRYVFQEDSPGLQYVQSQIIRYAKMKMLNSRAGVILRDGVKKQGVDHTIIPATKDLPDSDKQFTNLMSNLDMLKLDIDSPNQLSVIDTGQVWKLGGVDHAGLFDEKIIKEVNSARLDVQNGIKSFKNKTNNLFKEVDDRVQVAKYFLKKNTTGEEIYKTLSKGQVGIDELEEAREVYKFSIIESLYQNKDKRVSFDQISGTYRILDDSVNTLVEGRLKAYDKALAASTMEYITKQTSEQNRSVGASVTTGMGGNLHDFGTTVTTEKVTNGKALLQMIGADNINNSPQIKAINTGIRHIMNRASGDDRAYDIIAKIGAYMSGEQVAKVPISIRGVPRSLSIESWISRIYAINRNVVSPKYVATEALLQSFRTKQHNTFKEMLENKDAAELILKMLETGKPPKGKEAIRFYKMLVSAAARNDYIASETSGNEESNKEDETNMIQNMQKKIAVEPEKNNASESFFGSMIDRVRDNTNQDELGLAGSTIL